MSVAQDAASPVPRHPFISATTDWLVLAIVSPLVVLQRINVRSILLAIIFLEVTIQLDVYLGFRREISSFSGLGGFNLSLSTALLGILYLVWGVDLFLRKTQIDKSRVRSFTPMILYLGVVGISALAAYDRQLALFEVNLLVQAMLLAVYVCLNTKTTQDVIFIFSLVVLGVALQSLLIIVLRVLGESTTIATVLMRIDPGGRVGGTIGSPNSAGAYLAPLIPVCLALAMAPIANPLRRLALAAVVLSPIALVLTRSRGAWTAVAVGGALFLTYTVVWNASMLRRLVPMLMVGFCLMLPLMALAADIAVDHPLLGVGPNNFVPVMHRYATVQYSGVWLRAVHNKFLLVLSETGGIGLLLFLSVLISTLWRAFRIAKARHPVLSPLGAALGAGLLGQMMHMMVDIFNNRPQTTFLWLTFGLMIAIWAVVEESQIASRRSAY